MEGGWLGRDSGRITIVFLESSIELVPRNLWSHPQIVRTSRRYGVKPGSLILDKSLHYDAMATLPEKWKRGRPDILHVSLLVLDDSPLYASGTVEVFFQAYDGRVFKVKPGVRIPRHYDRFKGLMAQLLAEEKVPPDGEALIYKFSDSLESFLQSTGARLVLLSEDGVRTSIPRVVGEALATRAAIGIGAFPHGGFRSQTVSLASSKYSIMGGKPLKAWGVAGRLVWSLENMSGI